jgi:hypothetical protein
MQMCFDQKNYTFCSFFIKTQPHVLTTAAFEGFDAEENFSNKKKRCSTGGNPAYDLMRK